jgi:type VI secretion system protein ImpM
VFAVTDTATIDAVPAWFGKIACLGDFASRRLPQDTAQIFDTWLARGVEASRGQLGERWMNVYLTSPLWRFALAPGVIDTRWWFGVLMPSVDNVGRYFPLLVTQACNEAPHDHEGLNQLERWFSGMARAALAGKRASCAMGCGTMARTQPPRTGRRRNARAVPERAGGC